MHDHNYYNTLIQIAPDSPVEVSAIPTSNRKKTPSHIIAFDMLKDNPYKYTQEEILFEVHVRHKGYSPEEVEAQRDQLWGEFYAKPKACYRASPLTKKFGWGVHFDAQGRMALISAESEKYAQYAADESLKQLLAMRSSRKK